MEHELFQSKLKPLVDRALISDAIESSSSGEHPHRAAAIELILERSIRDRRERVLAEEASRFVELVCETCNTVRPKTDLYENTRCRPCPSAADKMKCSRCGTFRTEVIDNCTNCRGTFK